MSPVQSESSPNGLESNREPTALEKRDIEAFEFIIAMLEAHDHQLIKDLIELQRILDKKGRYLSEIVPFTTVGKGLIRVSHIINGREQHAQFQSLFFEVQRWLVWALEAKFNTSEDQVKVVKKLYELIDRHAISPYQWKYQTYKTIIKFIENRRNKINLTDNLELAIAAEELTEEILQSQSEIHVLSNILVRDKVVNYLNQIIKIWAENNDAYIDQRSKPIIAELDDEVFKEF